MSEEKATPRPWKIPPSSTHIIGNNNEYICCMYDVWGKEFSDFEANARLIVKAVNSYDTNQETILELVEALNMVLQTLLCIEEEKGLNFPVTINKAKKALAKAHAGQ